MIASEKTSSGETRNVDDDEMFDQLVNQRLQRPADDVTAAVDCSNVHVSTDQWDDVTSSLGKQQDDVINFVTNY